MKLIPYDKFEINSSFDNDEIRANLGNQIDNNITHMSYKEYQGVVSQNKFVIGRKNVGLAINSVKPFAYGKFNNTDSIIKITIRPSTFVVAFLGVIFAFCLSLFALTLDSSYITIPFIAYVLTTASFNMEYRIIKNDLMTFIGEQKA